LIAAVLTALLAAAAAPALAPLDPPAAPGSLAPNLATTERGDRVLLSWLEPARPDGKPGEGPMALRVAAFDGRQWTAPATVASGDRLFASWADVPAVAADASGRLYAVWPEKSGAGDEDYGLELARADSFGAPWRRLGALHEPGGGEHGFVSLLPEAGGVRAFWLDGREMRGDAGSMTLRTTLVGDRAAASERLDARVCDCCQTSASATPEGPIVVFRDRSEGEIRDVAAVRRGGGKWTASRRVAADGWKIAGCPVNGPAVASRGKDVAVAWFTGEKDRPRVSLAFSRDAGMTFGEPVPIDGAGPAGRVAVILDASGDAIVSWVASHEREGLLRVRRVAPDRGLGAPRTVAPIRLARSSGFPRIARLGDRLLVCWVDADEPFRLRAATLPLADVPGPASKNAR
jgi:hypothetical protein